MQTDIAANRASRKWTPAELAGRTVWELLSPVIFALSPRPFWLWRRLVLRAFGARIGRNVHIHPTARVQIPWNLQLDDYAAVGDRAIIYNLGHVRIGRAATVSQHAHLCAGTHDHRDPAMPLLKPPIDIGDNAWICADAFIGPGVKIGAGAVVAARAVAVRDVADGAIVAGNPARAVGRR